ncbi:LysM peptidoglycan-binding domain-containing protein [Solirubrobacter sp. CPCC 204708]|uniref:LysM peptidoglycan-binding domain-containing protein n=1 Tax=Solirubrobacter deserti TaxID=2282478 RepID=A0ABT4RIN9_9ACTN|nr:LysM domain-containing protein [Solirubrobacter deserti]MBE2320208.1 LysM peptidoglycan-binding domain-containing protein [Solirubrobacter deserti]MDA0138406.1 LysM peptidoglycan-binding domain-containing protein [Solirubrobacter deserti]
MAGRNPARFLAPIALIAFAFALYSVVSSDEEPTNSTPASQTATPSATAEKTSKKKKSSKAKTYTVKSGDTASGIAEKTGVDLETLLELNPDIDASTLSPGQKIRLEN